MMRRRQAKWQDVLRQCIAVGLCTICAGPLSLAQQSIAPVKPTGTIFFRPYKTPEIPRSRMTNSMRLASLIRAGKLYLTAQDAIALALENNIDLESDRYNALIAVSQFERQQAGGPLPGVPNATSQAGNVATGQGVSGSQAAAGVSNTGSNNNGGNATNTTISQIGPVTPTLDPTIQSVQSYAHISQPQANATQSQTPNLIDNTRNYNESISAGFLTGGKATLTYTDSYLNENSPVNLLNPSNGTTMTLSLQQNFLFGFGRALNSRNITIAKANIGINDLTFQTQVISVVVNVLNLYYGLVADYEDLKAKQEALTVAQRFFEDNKKQVQIGTMAPLDVTTAEAQVASSEQDLVISQTSLEQQQVSLKNVLSRNGLADPLLANVDVIPLDRIEVPEKDTLPPIKELISTALKSRPDLASDKLNLINAETSALGTENGVLPTLVGLATLKTQGLSGSPQIVRASGSTAAGGGSQSIPPGFLPCPPAIGPPGSLCEAPDAYFVGGVGKALGQTFRRDFPSQNAGAFFNPKLGNRQAQADNAIDQLSLRQTELQNRRTVNQVAVDVSNQVVGLQQARVRYQSAVKNRVLQEQLLQAEQKKFALGASTTFTVVTQQRDLATSQSAEVAALVAYSNARISLEQTLGTTLETNHISMGEVKDGRVRRASTLPPTLPDRSR